MKGAVVIVGAFAILLVAMFIISGAQLSVARGNIYSTDITTSKQSYIPSDTVVFKVRLLETNITSQATFESTKTFGINVYKDNTILIDSKSGVSQLSLSYPASGFKIGTTLFSFVLSPETGYSLRSNSKVTVSQTVQTDSTPPTITSYSTSGSGAGTLVNTQVRVVFSEPVQPISASDFYLSSVKAFDTPGTILQTGTIALLTPSSDLDYSTEYTATVSNIKDLAGNEMHSFSWQFTTMGDTYPPALNVTYPFVSYDPDWDAYTAEVYDRANVGPAHANAGVADHNVLTMTGTATDISGISEVKVLNRQVGQQSVVTGLGVWSAKVLLVPGNNEVGISAKDIYGNSITKTVQIRYETVGLSLIDVVFTSPISGKNGEYHTDQQYANVSGTASYDYAPITSVTWHNNFTGETGTAWAGDSHGLNWTFNVKLAKGDNPIWVGATASTGFTNYGAFTIVCTYEPPVVIPINPQTQPDTTLINAVGAVALLLILAGLFLRFVFDLRIGYLLIAVGSALLMLFLFGTLSQPPM